MKEKDKSNTRDKKNIPETSKISNDVKGVVFITTGILMLLSIFATDSSGLLGKSAKKFLLALLGIGSYIFPMLLFFTGISFVAKNGKIEFNKRFYGIVAAIINSLLFIQMINMEKYYNGDNILLGIHRIYDETSIFHGGIISYLIDIPLYKFFGNIGTYIIFVAVYIISFIFIMRISLNDLIKSIAITNKKKNKNKDIINVNNDVKNENEKNESSFMNNLNHKIKVINFLRSTENMTEDKILNVKGNNSDKAKVYEPKIIENEDKIQNAKNLNKEEKTFINEIDKELNEKHDYKIKEYNFPPVQVLNHNLKNNYTKNSKKQLINNASKLEETLNSFGVNAKVLQVTKGPSVTRFELQPSAGVKVSKITHLSDDIALSLAASSVRIEAPIPGKSAVGIEVPNHEVSPVFLREIIESLEFKNSNKNISFALGKDIGGNCVVSDLSKMPHLLIAGATGSGKSVCINALIISLLYKYSPDDVKLLLVDPKVVELNIYNNIPHLLIPVVTNPKKAAGALNWAVTEMTRRYNLFANNNVRNIEGYNELHIKGKIEVKLPWIVIIIDELADLMMASPREVEEYIARLAQMARAAGMHLVIATQRPSVDVITGVIKANIPSRISFAVSSQIDSRTIIDSSGAEKLMGKGDMLFYPVGEAKPIRVQGAFISEEEVERVVNFIKAQKNEPNYKEDIMNEIDNNVDKKDSDSDEFLEEAIRIVVENGQASTSFLQRKLRIGYNRAARIMEQLEGKGIISGKNGSKPRQILINSEDLEKNQ